MGKTWQHLLTAIVVVGLGGILAYGWYVVFEATLKQRHKD